MPRNDPRSGRPRQGEDPEGPSDLSEARERLAEAEAQMEAIQVQAADAEARAATAHAQLAEARAELADARQRLSQLQAELEAAREELSAERARAESAEAGLAEARSQLSQAREELREAAIRYREARLAASPEIPGELVPGGSIQEIDEQFEAAERVVSQLRQRLEGEARSARVPIGSPPRREPDLSSLSPAEKIRLGLRRS